MHHQCSLVRCSTATCVLLVWCCIGLLQQSGVRVRAALPAGALIGTVETSGEGCPSNSVQAAFTSDGGALAIMFNKYTANTNINSLPFNTFTRTTCDIAVSVLVPTGYSVQTYSLDFRGSTVVPVNTSSSLHADFLFAGSSTANSLNKVYRAKSENDFTFEISEHTDVTGSNTVASPCGQSTILRLNSHVLAQAGQMATDDALIQLYSVDLTSRVEVGLKWLSCPQLCAPADNNCGDHATCFITDTATNAKSCTCNTGYTMTSGGCVMDPCANKPCGNLPCSVVNDAYSCTCGAGYTYDQSSQTCVDVNECAVNNGGCYSSNGCHNTQGGFTCDPCPIGYQGNGMTCSKSGFVLTYNGNGCPAPSDPSNQSPGSQSVTATFTDSGSAIALMFSQFSLSVGAGDVSRSNKTLNVHCQVGIPVTVPPGYSVTTYALDYRGFAAVPSNSYGSLNMAYFFSGIQGQSNSTRFTPGMNDLYATRFPVVGVSQQPTSECGQDVILRLSTSLVGRRSLLDSDDLLLEIDSADLARQGNAYINLTWHVCPVCADGGSMNCGPYGTCRQGPTTQVCVCNDGYVKDASGNCVDINECATNNGGCPTNSVCTNLNPLYSCACPTGYYTDPNDGQSCVDINECETDNGGCSSGVQCYNTMGSYRCGTCQANYKGDGKNCNPHTCGPYPADLSSMTQPSCDFNSVPNTCSITCLPHYTLSGSATVSCVKGQWESSGCVMANECSVNNGGCSTCPLRVCSMTKRGPTCGACPNGYANNGDTQCTCTSKCPPVTCPTPSTNAKLSCNSYKFDTTCQLSCDAGYAVQGNTAIRCLSNAQWNTSAGNCVDINECSMNNGGCSPKATCVNSPGGFTCGSCPAGYYDASQTQQQKGGKGTMCVDVNECATNNGGCSLLSTCSNYDGGFSCGSCAPGYQGNGKQCVAVNLCATNNGGCDRNAVCSNTGQGGVFCQCPDGYVDQSQGKGRTCVWQDPCQLRPCDQQTQCQSQSQNKQSYSCTPCPLEKGMIDANGGIVGKNCIPATMVKLGTPSVSGVGCPQGTSLKLTGAGPNVWKLVLNFPSPFGWDVGQVPSMLKMCQFGLPLTFSYKSAAHLFNLGEFSYSASNVLNATEKVTATVDIFWTGEQSTPFVSFTSAGPIYQPNTVIRDSQLHTLVMPASGQEVILRMQLRLAINMNNIPTPLNRNVPLTDTKFVLSSVVVGQFVGLVDYSPYF